MKRFAAAALGAASLLASQCVYAQTPTLLTPDISNTSNTSNTSDTTGTSDTGQVLGFLPSSWFVSTFAGAGGGVVLTRRTGGEIYGEVGKTNVWHKLDFSVEAGWMSSVVSQNRIDAAGAIANYLAQTQGQAASATVKVPAGYAAVNVRRTVYSKPRYNVYALGGVGFGVLSPKTTFVLGGANVSGSVSQYGVTLGKDLAGSSTSALVNVGVGVTVPHGKWFGDISYRLTPIFTSNQTTLASRFNFGVARRF